MWHGMGIFSIARRRRIAEGEAKMSGIKYGELARKASKEVEGIEDPLKSIAYKVILEELIRDAKSTLPVERRQPAGTGNKGGRIDFGVHPKDQRSNVRKNRLSRIGTIERHEDALAHSDLCESTSIIFTTNDRARRRNARVTKQLARWASAEI